MAAEYKTRNRRPAEFRGRTRSQIYVYDNAVRQAEAFPERLPQRKKRISRQVAKNRNRAMSIGPAYVVFLAAAAVCAVLICMLYLSLQAEVISRSEHITAMQQELEDLTEANNAAYNAAADSVNLETVRQRAMNEMGMVYASSGTVIEYNSAAGEYVKQYSDIPESGILAVSGNASK